MKKLMLVVAAFLFLAGGLTGQAVAGKTTFLLDWIVFGKHAAFFAAQDKGFYKKVGLDVEYKRGFGSGRTIKDISAKLAPIGFADAGSLVNARGNSDVKVKEVAMIHAKTPMIAVFFKDKGYKTPKDLAGVTIGSTIATATRVIFPAFAAANGFDPKSIKWINMGYGQVLPSFLSGKQDVALYYVTEIPQLRIAVAKIGKELGYFSYGDWGVKVYSNGVVVRDATIESDPKFVRNAVKAVMEAFGWSLLHPDEAIENFLKYAPGMSKPIIRHHFAINTEYMFDEGVKRHGLGYMDHKKMDNTVELLTKLQKLKKRVPTEDMYTNRFLPQWPAIKAALGDKAM